MTDAGEKPLSHLYWVKAKQFVQLDAAARRLEDEKDDVLEEMKSKLIAECNDPKGMSEAKAERLVKITPEWKEFRKAARDAKTAALDLKHELHAIDMRHSEKQSEEATRRKEMGLV